jgi:hypothetical protein
MSSCPATLRPGKQRVLRPGAHGGAAPHGPRRRALVGLLLVSHKKQLGSQLVQRRNVRISTIKKKIWCFFSGNKSCWFREFCGPTMLGFNEQSWDSPDPTALLLVTIQAFLCKLPNVHRRNQSAYLHSSTHFVEFHNFKSICLVLKMHHSRSCL